MNVEKILSYPPELRQEEIRKYARKIHHKGSDPFDALLPELIKYGKHYKPKRTAAEYLEAMAKLATSKRPFHLDQQRPDINHPCAYRLFTIPSQHVYGNCIEECIDNALEEAERRSSVKQGTP